MGLRLEKITGGDIAMEPASATLKYRAAGTPAFLPGGDFFSFIASYALANIPRTFDHPKGTLYRQDIQVHETWYARYYEISVPYGKKKKEQEGAYQISVDQTGGTVHVTAGTRIAGYGPAADAVDNGGLIGVDGDEVKGTEIPVEETKLNVTYRHPKAALNRDYIKRVGRLVGFVNKDEFLDYEPGEVRFLGGNFTESEAEATAAYSFAISFNRRNFTVGGITITEKLGWDVISPTYKTDTDNDHLVKQLAYIEIVRPGGRDLQDFKPVFGWG